MKRKDVWFDSEGERCAAWLYPSDSMGDSAMVVMAHGPSATRRYSLGPFAERFGRGRDRRIVFDHRGFGDSEGELDADEVDFLPRHLVPS